MSCNIIIFIPQKCTVQKCIEDLNSTSQLASPWQLFIASELRTAAKCFQEVHHTLSLVHNWLKAGAKNTKTAVDFNLLHTLAENRVSINIFIFPRYTIE